MLLYKLALCKFSILGIRPHLSKKMFPVHRMEKKRPVGRAGFFLGYHFIFFLT